MRRLTLDKMCRESNAAYEALRTGDRMRAEQLIRQVRDDLQAERKALDARKRCQCGETGHTWARCPRRRCGWCDQPGHVAADCPERLKPPPPPPAQPRTPWVVLGVASYADAAAIKAARRAGALAHHPDRGGDPAKMAAINAAADQMERLLANGHKLAGLQCGRCLTLWTACLKQVCR